MTKTKRVINEWNSLRKKPEYCEPILIQYEKTIGLSKGIEYQIEGFYDDENKSWHAHAPFSDYPVDLKHGFKILRWKYISLCIVAFFLSSCATIADRCNGYGFQRGTVQYAQCLQQEDIAMRQRYLAIIKK